MSRRGDVLHLPPRSPGLPRAPASVAGPERREALLQEARVELVRVAAGGAAREARPPYHLPRSRSRSPMQTSAPADRRRTTPKTTKSRRRTRQSSESNMNSNGSERRRTLEAPELLRSRDPPPGSILAALRRTESSLTHGAATPVHCRGETSGSGTSILPIGSGDIPPGPWTAAPEEKTFLVEEN